MDAPLQRGAAQGVAITCPEGHLLPCSGMCAHYASRSMAQTIPSVDLQLPTHENSRSLISAFPKLALGVRPSHQPAGNSADATMTAEPCTFMSTGAAGNGAGPVPSRLCVLLVRAG